MAQRTRERANAGKRAKVAIRNAVRQGIELEKRAIMYGGDFLGIGDCYPPLTPMQKKVMSDPDADIIAFRAGLEYFSSQLEKALRGEKTDLPTENILCAHSFG